MARVSPFWTVAIFVYVVALPQAFLSQPIAAAPFSAHLGVALGGASGLLNVLTVAAGAGATAIRERAGAPPQMSAGRVRSALGGEREALVIAGQSITFFALPRQ